MLVRRWLYYLASIPTLLWGIREWPRVLALFWGLPIRRPLTVSLRQSGLQFRIRSAMDLWIIKETCLDREYERYGGQIQAGWNVVDVGAGLGDFALLAASRVGERGRVYAFEPLPESYALLEHNLRINQVQNVHLFAYALAGCHCRLSLVEAPEAVKTATVWAEGSREVEAWSLEEALEPLEVCQFLKMDCEGGEYDILLRAADGALEKIERICLEYHDNVTAFSHQDLMRFLQDKGFQVSLHPSSVQPDLGFLVAYRRDICTPD
jgi:FkbM family methyltransferase